MSQISISEYHCKSLISKYLGLSYRGSSITSRNDPIIDAPAYVIKPDMKFGGRAKKGLVGRKLDSAGVQKYLNEFRHKTALIDGSMLVLNKFLAEVRIEHEVEFFLAFDTDDRLGDTIYFSDMGGVNIESHRDKTKKILIKTGHSIEESVSALTDNKQLQGFIIEIYTFFIQYGFCYLEFNPITIVDGEICILDAVGKIDTCEYFRQKEHWNNLNLIDDSEKLDIENAISSLDRESGASMKVTILNPNGNIWLILGGGGASAIIFDAMTNAGLLPKIANYGELSGNPSLSENSIYIDLLIAEMLKTTLQKLYLVVAGGIANFTDISAMAKGLVSALDKHKLKLQERELHLIVRRGGINEDLALQAIKEYCAANNITSTILGSESYMTSFISRIIVDD